MLATLALATFLTAAPPKLASPGFSSVNLKTQLALFYSNDFTDRMREHGVEVLTPGDIELVLGIERQKELIGCGSEGSSCVGELADAFGVDGVITGSIGMFGNTFRININIISANDAKPLASFSQTVTGQKNVLAALAQGADAIAPVLYERLHKPMPVKASAQASRGAWGFVALGGAIGFVGLGGGLFIAAWQQERLLNCPPGEPCAADAAQAKVAHDRGQLFQGLGIAAMAVGAVCAGLGTWLFLRGPDDAEPKVALLLAPNGFGLAGSF